MQESSHSSSEFLIGFLMIIFRSDALSVVLFPRSWNFDTFFNINCLEKQFSFVDWFPTWIQVLVTNISFCTLMEIR